MAQQTSPDRAEYDAAKRGSWNCRHCGGGGLAVVFHPRYEGRSWVDLECVGHDGEVRPRPIAARVAAHCVCAMGRFMRAANTEETNRRIPCLQDVFDGRSRWLPDDPTRRDETPEPMTGRPNVHRWGGGDEPAF